MVIKHNDLIILDETKDFSDWDIDYTKKLNIVYKYDEYANLLISTNPIDKWAVSIGFVNTYFKPFHQIIDNWRAILK